MFASRWRELFLLICFGFVERWCCELVLLFYFDVVGLRLSCWGAFVWRICFCVVGFNFRFSFASIVLFELVVLMRMRRLDAGFFWCRALVFARFRHC